MEQNDWQAQWIGLYPKSEVKVRFPMDNPLITL